MPENGSDPKTHKVLFKMSDKCPRKLKAYPIKPCQMALNRMTKDKEGCEWYLDDANSRFCFWLYLHKHKTEPHSVTAIAKLWGTSVNNVSIAERSSHQKILKLLSEK